MIKRIILAVLLLAALTPGAAAGARPASIDCDAYVVDQAGVLKGGQRAQAAHAATKLQNVGADPRVVFIASFAPLGSVDDFEQALVKRCDSWRSADGQRKNNLVALIVALKERKASLSWGERWNRSLATQADRIRADFLNPSLADGAFGTAVADTFGETGRVLSDQLHPKPTAPATIVNEPGKPTNLWPLWIVLFLLAGVGLAALAVFVVRNRLAAHRAREQARGEALDADQRASDAALKLYTADDSLKEAAQLVAGTFGPHEAAEVQKQLETTTAAVGAFAASYQETDQRNDPQGKHSIDRYRAIAAAQDAATAKAADALKVVEEAQALIDRLTALAKSVPADLERSEAALGEAQAAVAAAVKDGYRDTDMSTRLAQASAHQKAVEKALAANEAEAAGAEIAAADELIAAVGAFAKDLPDLRAKLDTDGNGIALRITQAEKAIEDARQVFTELSATYAEDAWKPVRGNGSQAEHAVAYAKQALAHAQAASTMDKQEWQEARDALTAADQALVQATTLTGAIVSLKASLEQAKASAPTEVAHAEADLAQAVAYEKQYDADIEDSVKADLRAAADTIDKAKHELAQEKPNYLTVVKLAQQAAGAADGTLAKCQSEHEQTERLRRQAASAIASAESAIAQATSFLTSHAADVSFSAQEKLNEAKKAHMAAKATADPGRQAAQAQAAQTQAEAALSEALSDVDDAEEKRRRSHTGFGGFGTGIALGSAMGGHNFGGGGGGGFGGGGFGSGGFGGGGGGFSSGGFGGGGGGSSSGGW